MSEVPDMLTVAEAATILRVGRTTGYELASRWLDTEGEDGLPVIHVGRLLRVPRALFEEQFGLRVTWRSDGLDRRQSTVPPPVRAEEGTKPTAKPASRKRRRAKGDQSGLPFAD
jgi:hypothetical protein